MRNADTFADDSYIKDWRRMFDEDDLETFISARAGKIVATFKSDINPRNNFPEKEEFHNRIVAGVWADMLAACQDGSVPVTAFDRSKLWTTLKGRGCTQRNLSRNSSRIFLSLENANYSFNMRINLNEVLCKDAGPAFGMSRPKVTSLREEGIVDFVFMFDKAIPQIRRGIDEGYREMKECYDTEALRHERIQRMVDIMMQGRGIDYRCRIRGDKVRLEFQRIVFTKVEKEVSEDQLEEFLSSIPTLMETSAPRVTRGDRISDYGSAFIYRDDVYSCLTEK